MSVKTIDPKDYAVTADGNVITGFGDTLITAERQNPQVTSTAGAQGDVARAIVNDKRGNIVVTLLQTAPANLIFSKLMNKDGVDGGNSVFAFMDKDNRGDDNIGSEDTYITLPPRTVFSNQVEMREWTLESAKLDVKLGGIPDVA